MSNTAEDLLWVSQVILFRNKKAFEKLVTKYQSPLRRFLLHLTNGDKALSDDLSQETFIKAYLRLDSFKGASKFQTWLFRIGYNEFYDALRKKKITVSFDKEDEALPEEQIGTNVAIDVSMDIKEALKVLREDERTAVILFYMEGCTHPQIAEIMNCPLGTVKSYILRGKEKLHNYFKTEPYAAKHI